MYKRFLAWINKEKINQESDIIQSMKESSQSQAVKNLKLENNFTKEKLDAKVDKSYHDLEALIMLASNRPSLKKFPYFKRWGDLPVLATKEAPALSQESQTEEESAWTKENRRVG